MSDRSPKILFRISVAVNVIIAACCLLSAYGGIFSPDYFHAIPAIALLSFPAWVVVMPCVAIADLVTFRKTALIPIFIMILCIGPFLEFCPIHWGKTHLERGNHFSLMTYNTLYMYNYREVKTEGNLTAQAIIDSNADILCLQENSMNISNGQNVTQFQADTLKKMYPYHGDFQLGLPIYSRFKVTELHTETMPGASGVFEKYLIEIDSLQLTVYNVHLQSIGLDTDDKKTFVELTKGHARGNISKIKSGLLSKLNHAFKMRASQARIIRNYLDNDSAENIIVCGDFNDVAACYAVKTIMGNDLKNAYTEAGRGPSATYRDNRLYFHIDQILYKGRIKPVEIATLRIGNSDHYPVKAIFKIENQ